MTIRPPPQPGCPNENGREGAGAEKECRRWGEQEPLVLSAGIVPTGAWRHGPEAPSTSIGHVRTKLPAYRPAPQPHTRTPPSKFDQRAWATRVATRALRCRGARLVSIIRSPSIWRSRCSGNGVTGPACRSRSAASARTRSLVDASVGRGTAASSGGRHRDERRPGQAQAVASPDRVCHGPGGPHRVSTGRELDGL